MRPKSDDELGAFYDARMGPPAPEGAEPPAPAEEPAPDEGEDVPSKEPWTDELGQTYRWLSFEEIEVTSPEGEKAVVSAKDPETEQLYVMVAEDWATKQGIDLSGAPEAAAPEAGAAPGAEAGPPVV